MKMWCRVGEEAEDENFLSDELIKDKLPPQKDNELRFGALANLKVQSKLFHERSLRMKIRAKFYVL